MVKWPTYVRLQRQKKIILQRLKVPPSINQFKNTLPKNEAADLFKFLVKYQPEDKAAKKARLSAAASNEAAGGAAASGAAPAVIKYGLNHGTHIDSHLSSFLRLSTHCASTPRSAVTKLIEDKKAKLVIIAHDVNPIELVIFLPALCRKMDVPYCIVKGKGRLGTLVHKKNAAVIALTKVETADAGAFAKYQSGFKAQFNENTQIGRTWGGGQMGNKTIRKLEIREKARLAEEAKKANF
jgi:large subunit ribosomal protein L7Ae